VQNVATPFAYNGGSLDISNSGASGGWPLNGLTCESTLLQLKSTGWSHF
jgi:hypothetical protein